MIQPPVAPLTSLKMRGSTNESNIKGNSKFSQLMSEEKISNEGLERLKLILRTEDHVDQVNDDWSWKWNHAGNVFFSNSNHSFYTSVIPDDNIYMHGDVFAPPLHNQRELYFVPSLLSQTQVKSLLSLIEIQIQKQEQGLSPNTKCIVAIEDGERKLNNDQPDQCIASFLEPIIENQILPVARTILQEPNITVADSIVRWYIVEDQDEGSNENLPPHYDLTSFASMIIPLNPEECEGGLYVQYGASHKSRQVVDFEMCRQSSKTNENNNLDGLKGGDAMIHRYDVMHGVNLKQGTRFSLVLWMTEDEQSMKSRTAPWVTKDAVNRKSVHAAFLYAMNAQNGLHGVSKDEKVAQEYWEWAAERGHALSQYMLSMLLLRKGFDNDPFRKESKMEWSKRIVSLLKESADRGLDLSQHALAQTYRYGYHGVSIDESLAKKYYIAAARQGYKKSIEALLEKRS